MSHTGSNERALPRYGRIGISVAYIALGLSVVLRVVNLLGGLDVLDNPQSGWTTALDVVRFVGLMGAVLWAVAAFRRWRASPPARHG